MAAFRSFAARAALLAAVVLLACCSLPAPARAQNPPKLNPRNIVPNATSGRRTLFFQMRVTLGRGAPDCISREVILVNGLFQPTIEARTNDTVVITVINEVSTTIMGGWVSQLPRSLPQTSSGITLHWHGLYMWNDAAWYDGTSYATMCPIAPGTNFTYRFLVDEAEGTYLWHDHATANRANGLQGAFIVRNPKVASPFPTPEADYVVFMSDWFHDEGNAMAMRLNRPANASMANNITGLYQAVPAADSLLINGRGRFDDCSSNISLATRGDNGVLSSFCAPQLNPVVGPDADRVTGGCKHNIFYVAPGATYRFRLINSATQTYMSVCFENHTVTMLAADATPTSLDDWTYPSCIDINSGQRYDLLLTADQEVAPGTSFWISVHSQYKALSPSAYAIMQYTDPLYLGPVPSPVSSSNADYGSWAGGDRKLLGDDPPSHANRLLELELGSLASSSSSSSSSASASSASGVSGGLSDAALGRVRRRHHHRRQLQGTQTAEQQQQRVRVLQQLRMQQQQEAQEEGAAAGGLGTGLSTHGASRVRRALRQYPYASTSGGDYNTYYASPSGGTAGTAGFPAAPLNPPTQPHEPPHPSPPPPRPPAPPVPAARWPTSPPLQPGVQPWTDIELTQVFTHEGVLGYLDNYDFQAYWQQFSHVGGEQYFSGVLYYPANQTININITAPLMTDTGMLRWAMNNVAMPVNPPCNAVMRDIATSPGWLSRNTLNTSNMAQLRKANLVAAADSASPDGTTTKHTQPSIYINGQPAPMIPIVGKHVAILERNQIVDIVINNRPGDEGNPDAVGGPAIMAQHPMHMHGHKFFVLGIGSGVYNATLHRNYLNSYNPMFRDTLTLPVGSWAVLRFTANNPGLWPFHCHIMWHSFMGQQMYLLEDIGNWPKPPAKFPRCNTNCLYNFANYSLPYINRTYGNSSTNSHQLP